ncbi:MAG: protein-L-isoaspartate(D-aspartate) O-methyltransferase [Gammaproteobacteria bacterium]|nr:protein-L-isoaspartate(D-aspartate) O-methyltransferase [Gammaproteobacteria bacterium]
MYSMMLWIAVALLTTGVEAAQAGEEDAMRSELVEEIRHDFRATSGYTGVAEMDPAVARALERVERHRFVPDRLAGLAYENDPLPIGEGQTISQPFIVALMTELLDVDADSRVLEIGTGSGYQAAVLGEIVAEVWSVEIVESLADRAAATLEELGYGNVHVRHGDGMLGWPEQAPFDGIIVTAAGATIPETLTDQLAPGGRLVMPVGGPREAQNLVVARKAEDGSLSRRTTLPVRFVPVTGEHGGPGAAR